MKATGKLLAAALIAAAGATVSIDAQAAERSGAGARGPGSAGVVHGNRHGGHGHRHGHGHWRGHYGYPSWGFYFGAPLVLGWGWPGYYDYYPHWRGGVVYREVERYPQSFPEGVLVGPPVESTQVPRGEGEPTRGPLYMNYCESAKAYFPKVTACPEGWRLATPAS